MKRCILLVAVFACLLTSCSVAMAARKDGVSITKLQACRTRGQVLACGVVVVDSMRCDNGDLVETYQVQKERGSVARAFMHGVLDVSTLGVWEVLGTPIEAHADQKQYYCIRVYYDECEVIKKVELL